MAEPDLASEYAEFWDDLLREAEVTGESQNSVFFRRFGSAAAENGDCADLTYAPVRRDGHRGFQADGYSIDIERGELHIAVCDLRTERQLQALNADGIQQMFGKVKRLLEQARDSAFMSGLEEESPTFEIASQIYFNWPLIERIKCVLFSNARLSTRRKTVDSIQIDTKEMTFNVIDFTRWIDIRKAGSQPEAIELDVSELHGEPLTCLRAHVGGSEYEAYLVVVPGQLLARIYSLYGARLMEQNVRTFLQARTAANNGIITTATQQPEMFFAFNNGITATATAVDVVDATEGGLAIRSIKNLQIVNGGQTTASLLYARDRNRADLSRVAVQMKLSVVPQERVEAIVPLISRYANTQNRINEADFFSSHPFHIEMQQISRRLAAPLQEGALSTTKWFYERARGQYRNEEAGKPASDRRRFEAEFPKDQVIEKLDLAKYVLTFDGHPHVVSLGAQKCFAEFAKLVANEWQNDRSAFDEDYFRRTVGMTVLYRWTDGMVGHADWYRDDRGYKANIVTYALAWLSTHLAERHAKRVDFSAVWQKQSVPLGLQQALAALAPQIAKVLKSPPAEIRNISEYAKKHACWARVSGMQFSIPLNFTGWTIDLEEQRRREREARPAKAMDTEILLERFLVESSDRIGMVEKHARSRGLLSPLSQKAIQKVAGGNLALSKPERNALRHLFARLADQGTFDPTSGSS